MDAIKNFAYSTVATAPSPATTGTSLVLASGEGALFPQPSTDGEFNIVVWITGANPLSANAEIVRVTARSTDTLTITREQEGTTARTIIVGDQVMLAPTKKVFDDIETLKANLASPVFTTQITTPVIVGGTAVNSKITHKSTTGVGTTDGIAHQFTGGNNGATVIATMLNNGNVGIGTTSPAVRLEVTDVIRSSGYTFPTSGVGIDMYYVAGGGETGTGYLTSYNYTTAAPKDLLLSGLTVAFSANVLTQMKLGANGGLSLGSSYVGTDPGAGNMIISGNVGIGTKAPTAVLHLKAGTATASTAPIKLTAGTVNTTSEAGAIEFDGTNFFFSI